MSHFIDSVKDKIESTLEKVNRRLSHDNGKDSSNAHGSNDQGSKSKINKNMDQDSSGIQQNPGGTNNYGQQAQNTASNIGQNAKDIGNQAQNLGQQSIPQPNVGTGPGGYNP
ncbi:hypothetical protein LPJ56_006238 [Coemansia sp. RSA 2599]|nr:hypothetical protein LPJ75_006265 [Coemansia sp. RSA 2598]KAJ1807454.1 hypothetical protein LPJ56_006238 [Coemansia sp. RSA 2599]